MPARSDRLRAELDRFVAETRPDRDRFVDFVRVFSIAVVVVWHWTLSITHWQDGALIMPNPIHRVPGAWLATWVLQVMPLFFFVGGFANHAGWTSLRRRGGGWREFYRTRARRLLLPPLAVVVVWLVLDGLLHLVLAEYRTVLEWGLIVFRPFWFLAAYVWVVALVPVTARLHQRYGLRAVLALAALVAFADVLRYTLEPAVFDHLNSALIWVFVHQLGYLYRDGTLERIGVRGQLALVVLAAGALAAATQYDVYPVSMVAVRGAERSNMWPTTAAIALVAVLQAGLAMLLRPRVARWLERRSVWKVVVAGNAVILTVFVWHMTAKVAFIGLYEAAGFELLSEATVAWWLERPLWLIGPALLLLPLVVTFMPLELQLRQRRR